MEQIVGNPSDLGAEAQRFLASLSPNPQRATLITLSGNLGAGKTAFTKALAQALTVEVVVNSPTFVLEKIYPLAPSKPFKQLIHIDAYRLEKGADLGPLGFNESMKDPGNLILLEWPEKVEDGLPTPDMRISFEVQADDTRKITYA